MQSLNNLLTNNVTMNNEVNNLTNNDNVTMNNVSKFKIYNSKDIIADKLIAELGNESYRVFYCKVAYKLSESQIWSALEQAKKGKYPAKYFTWLVKKMGV